MPDARSNAGRLLDAKTSVPSEMRTAEWRMVPQWERERSFYMAGVLRTDLLQEFRDEAAAIANGTRGMEESRRRLQDMLAGADYQPLPGQEGTIKDLRTSRRIHVSLRTNVRLLQGWSQKERGLRSQAVSPAWELVRFLNRRNIRDWQTRFERAGGVLIDGRMIAMKDSEVWFNLGNGDEDSLGVDYPPFAWGSGMGWQGVPYAECKALGVIPPGWRPPPLKPVGSPNATLETRPRVTDSELRQSLTNHLRGLAQWDGDRLVFTDPNGTRKASPDRLAEIWKRPLPDKFGDLPGGGQKQREAFLEWIDYRDRFRNLEASGANKAGRLDRWEDLQRVVMRLEPTGREAGELVRSVPFDSAGAVISFMGAMETDGYQPDAVLPVEMWRPTAWTADKSPTGRYHVTFILAAGHPAARDIQPLVRLFGRKLDDDFVMLPKWAGLRVKRIVTSGSNHTVELEAAP